MRVSRQFRDVLQMVTKGLKQGEVVARTGVSPAYLNDMLTRGRIPSYEKLSQLADGLGLSPVERQRLFTAAGHHYEPPHPSAEGLTAEVVELARRIGELAPERRHTFWRLLEEPHRLDAVGVLLRPEGQDAAGKRESS